MASRVIKQVKNVMLETVSDVMAREKHTQSDRQIHVLKFTGHLLSPDILFYASIIFRGSCIYSEIPVVC